MSDKQDNLDAEQEIGVTGPGIILQKARLAVGLSQTQVADKLNFRIELVQSIEADNFDPKLPSTYNRGYLRGYAGLVKAPVEQILAAYDSLGVGNTAPAELRSYSLNREKTAQNKLLVWMSWLVVVLLLTSTLMWLFQDSTFYSKAEPEKASEAIAQQTINQAPVPALKQDKVQQPVLIESTSQDDTIASVLPQTTQQQDLDGQSPLVAADNPVETGAISAGAATVPMTPDSGVSLADEAVIESLDESSEAADDAPPVRLSQLEFRFSGDCWVNIYDSTGEQIAWGVKKSGYVMKISGVAPWQITLGRPELAEIDFDAKPVDLSQFKVGNIAKFSLPFKS